MKSSLLLTVFCFFLFVIPTDAENSEIDSLLQIIGSTDEQGKSKIYNRLAKIDSRNSPQKKIDYGTKALEIARKFEQNEEEFHALMQIATGYAYLGDNSKALEYDLNALRIAKELDNDKFLSDAYSNIGYDYNTFGNFEKSLEYNLKSLDIKNRMFGDGILKNEKSLSNSYNNIGSTYSLLRQYNKALEHHQKALEIRKRLSDSTGIARSLHNIGVVYEKQNMFDESLKYYQEALAIRKRLRSKREIAETLNNIGIVHKATGNLEKALTYFNEALQIFNTINNKGGAAPTINNIAGIYLAQKTPNKAYPHLLKGIELANETGQKKILSEIYANLIEYYTLKGDFKNAFEIQEKFLILKDTLYSNDLVERVSEMQVKYETEKKEKEIEILARDKEIQNLKIKKQSVQLYFLIAFIILVVIISILVFSKVKLKQKQVRAELEKKNLETEKRLLRSQMNPHFIFNSMNSIQSFISGNDSLTAMTYLSKFAQLMRNILDNSRKSLIALSDEINTLELYVELERIRFNKKFDYKFEVDPELPVEAIFIPPMLIQPFVENSIKHGFTGIKDGGLLKITFNLNKQLITCIVQDNGIGRDKAMAIVRENKKGHRSLGMQLTQERLDSLSKLTNQEVKYNIIDLVNDTGESKGTEVRISLPYEKD